MSDKTIENVSTEDTIATAVPLIGDVTFLDALSAFGIPILIMVFGQMILPPAYQGHALAVAAVFAVIGSLALVATPNHTSLGQFMSNFWHHKRRPKQVRYRRATEDEDVLERGRLEFDERAQDLTEIERVYPQYDALELEDGTMVGAVRVTSANLDTADSERKHATVQAAKNFFENVLDFQLQIYVTTHGFDAAAAAVPYNDRLGDADLQENPVLDYHARHHIRWLDQTLDGRPIREFYLVVPVDPQEVREANEDDETVSSSLQDIPYIGELFGAANTDEHKLTADEVRLQQLSYLNDRLGALQSQFINSLGEETSSERVKAAPFIALLKEYWEGERVNNAEYKELIGARPVIAGDADDINTQEVLQ